MKNPRVAKISLTVALIWFFAGFLVMCICPGWYAIAALFAAIAVASGSGRVQSVSILLLLLCLAFVWGQTVAKIHDQKVRLNRLERQRQSQETTNQIDLPATNH